MTGAAGAILAGLAVSFALAGLATRAEGRLVRSLVTPRGPEGPRDGASLLSRIGSLPLVRLARPSVVVDLPDAPSSEELAGARVVLAVCGAVLGVLGPVPVLAPVLAFAGFRIPEVWLGRKRTARLHAAERELPLFLDLLASSVFAGLSGPLAVRAAVAVSEGPLAEEFARALAAADLGARWRDELTSVGDRIASADLHRAIGILARSDALGASLSERLAEVATDARESRRSVTMERARRAPVKMLFPLVFLILPSFLLLTVVPVLLTTIRSIR